MSETGNRQTEPSVEELQRALADLQQKNRALEQLVAQDELTGLYNRRKLEELLSQEIQRAERYRRALSVILIDLDHFKEVNDSLGHAAGDSVLADTASRLAGTVRASDFPGRLGGDEFMVICPETGMTAAMVLAERLRGVLEPARLRGVARLTASFGVASHSNGRTAADVLQKADEALYRAKQSGRNRVEQDAGAE